MRRFDAGGVSSVCCVTNMSVGRDPDDGRSIFFQFAGHLYNPRTGSPPAPGGRSSSLILAKEAAEVASRAKSGVSGQRQP